MQNIVDILATLISAISFERKSYDAAPMRTVGAVQCKFLAGADKFLQVALAV